VNTVQAPQSKASRTLVSFRDSTKFHSPMMFCLKEVSRIKLDIVSNQHCSIFVFKGYLLVMALLLLNLILDHFNLRITDSECTISLLPLEMTGSEFLRVHPCRRAALQFSNHCTYADRWRKVSKNMDVVGNSTDLDEMTGLLSNDAADVSVEAFLKSWRDQQATVLCAKHDVVCQFCE
jgi:hypothetical protein